MVNYGDLTFGMDIFSIVFNFLIGVMVFRLRKKSEDHPMTLSQRWGLTILSWLYLVNAIVLFCYVLSKSANLLSDPVSGYFLGTFGRIANILSFLPLLTFGLVYPRPIMRWGRLSVLMFFLAVIWFLLLPLQNYVVYTNWMGGSVFDPEEYLYLPVTFIPIFLWLPEYDRQTSPQMRMTLTLLIWGYLFYHFTIHGSILVLNLAEGSLSTLTVVVMTLVSVVVILLMRTIYHRRGHWTPAEKANIILIIICTIGSLFGGWVFWMDQHETDIYSNPVLSIIFYVITLGGWSLVRPALFSYGLLRYQFFGPDVKADMDFIVIGGLLGSTVIFLLVNFNTYFIGTGLSLGLSAIIATVAYFPMIRLSTWVVKRLLPLTKGGALNPVEKRITYLMGLQTAVIKGEIDEPYDIQALEKLRRMLKVSKREHRLLIAAFAKEKPTREKEEIEEVFLFHKDGTLLGHAASKALKAKTKGAVMATMFAAVRDFAKDALTGDHEHLDSIEYGYTTLIIEVEGDIAIGVMMRGRDNPNVRQQMREVLATVTKNYIRSIEDLVEGGNQDEAKRKAKLKGLEGKLGELIED